MNQVATIEQKQLSASQQFRVELEKMGDQFSAALPSHIKPEKFQRVVMTAVLSDPDVLKADRKSLMESAIRAAQDGLLPDKREGAFVVFNTKVKVDGKDQWIKAVQWMPMVGGIIKRIHQSGEIKMLTARVVYGGDHFRTWIDDTGEHVEYEPSEEQDTDIVRRVFAMATTVDGAVYVEPLSVKDVEKIRSVSRGKERGPWSDWWEEMAKKSAIRRLAKRLPLSVEIHDLIQRDNGFFDLEREPEARQPSVLQRLRQNATQEPVDGREGFDRSFVQSETSSALTGEILPNDDDFQSGDLPLAGADEPAVLNSSASTEEAAPSSSVDTHTDASDSRRRPASEISETADGQSRQVPTSAVSRDAETETLIQFAKDVLQLAASEGTTRETLKAVEGEYSARMKALSDDGYQKARSISSSARAILEGNTSLESAVEFFSERLVCRPAEIGGDNG